MSARAHQFSRDAIRRRVLRRSRWEGFKAGVLFRHRSPGDVMALLHRIHSEEFAREQRRCTHPRATALRPSSPGIWCPDCRDYIDRSSSPFTSTQESRHGD